MTLQALANLITVSNQAGVVQNRYQNGKVGTPLVFENNTYSYLSFLYRGAMRNRTGDNFEAELTLAVNAISTNIVREAVVNRWVITVATCNMQPSTFEVANKISEEIWMASSLSYDTETVVALLSSGIDAVGANAPTRRLTQAAVGALPTTAQMQNR